MFADVVGTEKEWTSVYVCVCWAVKRVVVVVGVGGVGVDVVVDVVGGGGGVVGVVVVVVGVGVVGLVVVVVVLLLFPRECEACQMCRSSHARFLIRAPHATPQPHMAIK